MWLYPRNPNGPIRYFDVKIILKDKTVYEVSTLYQYVSLNINLTDDVNCKVVITPVTHINGVSTSSNINFYRTGKSLLTIYAHLIPTFQI